MSKPKYSNIIFIDNSLKEPKRILETLNKETLGMIYSYEISQENISEILDNRIDTIKRVGFYFHEGVNIFLEKYSFFNSKSIDFIKSIVKRFRVEEIDFFSCSTLKYKIWRNFYDILKKHVPSVQINAQKDQSGKMWSFIKNKKQTGIENMYFMRNNAKCLYPRDLYYADDIEEITEQIEHNTKKEILSEVINFYERLPNFRSSCKKEFKISGNELGEEDKFKKGLYSVECCGCSNGSDKHGIKNMFRKEEHYNSLFRMCQTEINSPAGKIKGKYSQNFYNPDYCGAKSANKVKIFYTVDDIYTNTYDGEYVTISLPFYVKLSEIHMTYIDEDNSIKNISILGSNNLGKSYELVGQYRNFKGVEHIMHVTNSKKYNTYRIIYESKNQPGAISINQLKFYGKIYQRVPTRVERFEINPNHLLEHVDTTTLTVEFNKKPKGSEMNLTLEPENVANIEHLTTEDGKTWTGVIKKSGNRHANSLKNKLKLQCDLQCENNEIISSQKEVNFMSSEVGMVCWKKENEEFLEIAKEEELGKCVVVSGDGNTIACQCYDKSTNIQTVNIYTKKEKSHSWKLATTLYGGNNNKDYGSTLCINHKGTIVAIGVPQNKINYATLEIDKQPDVTNDYVQVYRLGDDNLWKEMGNRIFSDNGDDCFGRSISFCKNGTFMVIGAPQEGKNACGYITTFNWNDERYIWEELDGRLNCKSNDMSLKIGDSISLCENGNALCVGTQNTNTGNFVKIVIYEWDTMWKEREILFQI